MLAAPGTVHLMPESLSRWPMIALPPGFDHSGADEHAQGAEMLVAHPVGVGFEVAQLLVAFAGRGADEVQVPPGGQQGGNVPRHRVRLAAG